MKILRSAAGSDIAFLQGKIISIRETLTAHGSKFQSLNSYVQQQHDLIAELQKQLNSLKANQVNKVVEQQLQHKPLQVDQVLTVTQVKQENVGHDTVKKATSVVQLRSDERSENKSLGNSPTPELKTKGRLNHQMKKNLDNCKATKSHSCNECGRSFSDKYDLTRHLRIHTGEKPYECEECGKSFSDRSNLGNHLRIHTGEKPHECKVCGKSFNQSYNLRRHLKIHIGEKSFVCDICNRSFRQKITLVHHFKVHTGKNRHECKTNARNPLRENLIC